MQTPQIIYQFTEEQMPALARQIVDAWKEGSLKLASQKEMCTRQVKKNLLEKGYKVSSEPAFLQLIKTLGLDKKRVKRGKEYWFKTSDIDEIPSRNLD